MGELEEKLKLDNIQFRKVPIILKKGQVSFHHCLTIHGSDVNRAASPRQSLAVHMQDAANRYRLFKNEQGIPWRLVIDRMCRTIDDETPDYTDPDVFPVLWSDENV